MTPWENLANRILRYPGAIAMRLRILYYRLLGARLVGRCWLRRIEIPRNPWDILIEAASLDDHVVLLSTGEPTGEPRIVIRRGAYINRFTMIDASERIEVGEDCMIGPYCYITDHDHGFKSGRPVNTQPLVGAPVKIGNDAWLGAGVVVLKGVEIGKSAVIGAGSVVTRDVPAGVVAVGVPARVLRSRDECR